MNIKSIIVCASALVFGLCGCDNGSTGTAASTLATGPRTVDGALVSAGGSNKTTDDTKVQWNDKIKKGLPDNVKEFLTKAGLDDIDLTWVGVSILDVEFDEDGCPKEQVPGIVAALAFKHDADKLFAALKEEAGKDGTPQVKDAKFLGENGLVMSDSDLTIAMASLSGEIVVFGTSEACAEKAVALYRDGKGGKDFALDGDRVFKIVANAIGERVFAKLPASTFEGALGPDTDSAAIMKGVKDASAIFAATADNGVGITVKVDTASADDAAKIAAHLTESLTGFKAMMTMVAAQSPDPMPLVDILNSVNIASDGASVSAKATLTGEPWMKLAEEAMK